MAERQQKLLLQQELEREVEESKKNQDHRLRLEVVLRPAVACLLRGLGAENAGGEAANRRAAEGLAAWVPVPKLSLGAWTLDVDCGCRRSAEQQLQLARQKEQDEKEKAWQPAMLNAGDQNNYWMSCWLGAAASAAAERGEGGARMFQLTDSG